MTNLEKYIDDIASIIHAYGFARYNTDDFSGFAYDVLKEIDEDNFCVMGSAFEQISNIKEWLLSGYKEPILDEEEKHYLEEVIKPFKDIVESIVKYRCGYEDNKYEYIEIKYDGGYMEFPTFKENKMYKGMKLKKPYTVKELGLFSEVEE